MRAIILDGLHNLQYVVLPMADQSTPQASASDVDCTGTATKAFETIHRTLGDGRLLDAVIARKFHHFPGLVAGLEQGFPGLADIEHALLRNAFPPADVRIYSERHTIDLKKFKIVSNGRIQPQMVADAALMDSTLVFNMVEQRIEKAHVLARRVEEWLGDPVQIGLIATYGRESGLPSHHDQAGVLIVQVEGSKDWTFLGDPFPPGLDSGTVEDDSLHISELTMNPGDVLFVPGGQRHRCSAQGFSVHVGIIFSHVDGRVVRDEIVKAIDNDLDLQEPAIAILGAANDRILARKYRAHLHAVVDSLNIEKMLADSRKSLQLPGPVELRPAKRQRTMPL